MARIRVTCSVCGHRLGVLARRFRHPQTVSVVCLACEALLAVTVSHSAILAGGGDVLGDRQRLVRHR